MYKNGGYAIVSHDDANIYSKVQGAYTSQKPILFYDDDNTCYFIDTIKYGDDDDLIMTKGGKTFTVTTNNTLSSEGEIQVKVKKLYKHFITFVVENISSQDSNNFFFTYYSYDNNIINSYDELYTLIKNNIKKLSLDFPMIDVPIFNNKYGNYMYISNDKLLVQNVLGDDFEIGGTSASTYYLRDVNDEIQETF